jgi:hypothetical protein
MYGISFLNEEEIFNLNIEDKCSYNELVNRVNMLAEELIFKPNWYHKYGIYYYFKKTSTVEKMLNHFLCEHIADIYSLKTPHFITSMANKELGIASKNFRSFNKTYVNIFDDFNINLVKDYKIIIDILKKQTSNFELLMDDLIRFLAFQFYTSLNDAHSGNLLFQKKDNEIRLDTLFDFDYAFCSITKDIYTCRSDFLNIDIPSNEFYELIDEFPKLKDYIKMVDTINIDNILENIEEENNFILYNEVKDSYKEQDEMKKNLVRTLRL